MRHISTDYQQTIEDWFYYPSSERIYFEGINISSDYFEKIKEGLLAKAKEADLESMRSGWFNSAKIALPIPPPPVRFIKNRIRNQLPYKRQVFDNW